MSSTPLTPDQLFAMPLFAPTFSAFLRRNGQLWRKRRIDRFAPVDLDLATRQTSIQGVIEPELLETFVEENRSALEIDSFECRRGDGLVCWIPAVSHPKRLLLDFSVRGAHGESLPMLSRMEGSKLVAQDLLGLLTEKARSIPNELSDPDAVISLLIVLTALAYQNPHGLSSRLRLAGYDRALQGEDLQEWVGLEGEWFLPRLGDLLLAGIRDQIRMQGGATFSIPDNVRNQGGLRHFQSLESLLIHGIRDVLKTTVEWAPPREFDPQVVTRNELMADPALLASKVTEEVMPALDLLTRMLLDQKDAGAEREILAHLDRWTAYVVMPIEVGVPFNIKFSEALPLAGKKRSRRPFQTYPLALRDAAAYHVEVSVEDAEICCAPRVQVVSVKGSAADRFNVLPVDWFFGTTYRNSANLIHLYTSRRIDEAEGLHTYLEDLDFVPSLRIRLGLVRSVFWGYVAASVSFLIAACYCLAQWIPAIRDHREPSDLTTLATVSGLAVTLSLWLTAIRHPRPIVYRQLFWARVLFAISLIAILTPGVIFGVQRVADHWRKSDPAEVPELASSVEAPSPGLETRLERLNRG